MFNRQKCYSKTGEIELKNLEEFIKSLNLPNTTILMIEDYEVSVGIYQSGEMIFTKKKEITKFIQELRFFNEFAELKFIRLNDNKYRYRYLSETENIGSEFNYDKSTENYLLNGTKVANVIEKNDITFTTLTEDSGVTLTIPLTIESNKPEVYLEVVNYLDYTDNGLLYFSDARLSRLYEKGVR